MGIKLGAPPPPPPTPGSRLYALLLQVVGPMSMHNRWELVGALDGGTPFAQLAPGLQASIEDLAELVEEDFNR